MSGEPEKEDERPFLAPWETEDQAELEPPSPASARQPAAEPDYGHPLLQPVALAQEALSRLETRAETASPAVAEGLLARMSYREAAGWLGYAHVWIHPHDLALRDRGLTSSYGAAFRAGRLNAEIPATTAQGSDFEVPPSDILVEMALKLARLWRRLAEMRTWRPLSDAATVQETLQSLGCRGSMADAEIAGWMTVTGQFTGPSLLRAGRAARDWMNRLEINPRNPDSIFLAACLWHGRTTRHIPLPFWSAPELHHNRLDRHIGLPWMVDFLDCAAAAARTGMIELDRLQKAEEKGRLLGRTARSRLPDAVTAVLRAPILTVREMATEIGISPEAALRLLGQLAEAGVIREATGRASWRAFTLV